VLKVPLNLKQPADIDNVTSTVRMPIRCTRWRCTLSPPGEYNRTIRVRWRCGLVSNYFDHIIIIIVSLGPDLEVLRLTAQSTHINLGAPHSYDVFMNGTVASRPLGQVGPCPDL